MFSVVSIPDLGFSLSGYVTTAIISLGAIVAVVIGGTIVFVLIRAGVRWLSDSFEHSACDDDGGEWEDYMTPAEQDRMYSGSISFEEEQAIRRRCYARMR